MFYPVAVKAAVQATAALVSLTPAESKRLIAKGVAALPEVKKALSHGLLIISRGTTNAFVAEELLAKAVEPKWAYTRGCVVHGELMANESPSRWRPLVFHKGQVMEMQPRDALQRFRAGDVFIKGANAVDPQGYAGILVAGAEAATIGEAWPIITARGANLVVPVGLEKLIPSVVEASRHCGQLRFKYSTGLPCGLVPLVNVLVVTEVEAFGLLFGIKAVHVSSGGIGGSEGSVVLSLEGSGEDIERAFDLVKSVKGEREVGAPEGLPPAAATLNHDAFALWLRQNPSLRPVMTSE